MPRRVGAVRAWRDPRGVSFLRLQQAADERAAVPAVQGKFQPQAEDLLDRSESGFISSRRGLFPIKIKLSPICFRSSRVQRRVAQLKIPVYGGRLEGIAVDVAVDDGASPRRCRANLSTSSSFFPLVDSASFCNNNFRVIGFRVIGFRV